MILAMENRVEDLNAIKANKSDIVMTTDLEALLTAHASELDRHLEVLKEEILHVIETKADKEEMAGLDAKIGARVVTLETAILKGLKAISDKVRGDEAIRKQTVLKHCLSSNVTNLPIFCFKLAFSSGFSSSDGQA